MEKRILISIIVILKTLLCLCINQCILISFYVYDKEITNCNSSALRLDISREKENLSRLIKRPLWNLWNAMLLKLLEEKFRDPFRDASMPTLRGYGRIFRGNEERRDEKARRGDESARRPTRKAARISGPFDEMPNVPLFAQQRRSNTGSCPFPRCHGTSRTWGEIPERSRGEILPRSLAVLRVYLKIPQRSERERKRDKGRAIERLLHKGIAENFREISPFIAT